MEEQDTTIKNAKKKLKRFEAWPKRKRRKGFRGRGGNAGEGKARQGKGWDLEKGGMCEPLGLTNSS